MEMAVLYKTQKDVILNLAAALLEVYEWIKCK